MQIPQTSTWRAIDAMQAVDATRLALPIPHSDEVVSIVVYSCLYPATQSVAFFVTEVLHPEDMQMWQDCQHEAALRSSLTRDPNEGAWDQNDDNTVAYGMRVDISTQKTTLITEEGNEALALLCGQTP